MMTDTLGNLVSQTDTLEALAKTPYAKRQRELNKEIEKWQKEQDRKKKREESYDSIYPAKPLEPTFKIPQQMDPDTKIEIEMPTPLQRVDTAAVHLYSMIDSAWYEAPFTFQPIPHMLRFYRIEGDWRPDTEYSLEIDSAAFEDIYGHVSQSYKRGMKVKSLDEYSTLTIKVSGVADSLPLRVRLLNKNDGVVKEVLAKDGVVRFDHVNPDKYYLSAFIDVNDNGLWDTGDYDEDRQAEPVYYYPREIECKEKWDVTQQWNLTALPRYKQKPYAITKQKADGEKKLKNRNADRARELGIEYIKKTNLVEKEEK